MCLVIHDYMCNVMRVLIIHDYMCNIMHVLIIHDYMCNVTRVLIIHDYMCNVTRVASRLERPASQHSLNLRAIVHGRQGAKSCACDFVGVQVYGTWEDDEAIYVVEEYTIMA